MHLHMDITNTLPLSDLSDTLGVCVLLGSAQTNSIDVSFRLANLVRTMKRLREEHFGPDSPFEIERRKLVDKHTKTDADTPEVREFKSVKDNEEFKAGERMLLKQVVTVTMPSIERDDLAKIKLFDEVDGKKTRIDISPGQLEAIMWLVPETKELPKSKGKK